MVVREVPLSPPFYSSGWPLSPPFRSSLTTIFSMNFISTLPLNNITNKICRVKRKTGMFFKYSWLNSDQFSLTSLIYKSFHYLFCPGKSKLWRWWWERRSSLTTMVVREVLPYCEYQINHGEYVFWVGIKCSNQFVKNLFNILAN